MITAAEIARAIQGCWRLARLDPSGMDFFDKTIEGFWRSFWAAALTAPVYLLFGGAGYDDQTIAAAPARYYTVEATAYVISWVAFPLAMFYVSRLIDRSEEYIAYIVAYNWSGIFQAAIFLPVLALAPADPAAASAWHLFGTVAYFAILAYVGYIAKTALRISVTMAIALVALDVVLTEFIAGIRHGLILGA